MRRKFARCLGVASESRQDQASGTLMTRPSASRAMISSALTWTAWILDRCSPQRSCCAAGVEPGFSRLLFAFTARLAALPSGRIAMQVDDSEHKDLRCVDSVENAVGKLAWDGSADLSVDYLVLHRVQM